MLRNEEEFNNFMHRATEVSEIVKKLSSADADQIKMGIADADRLLTDKTEVFHDKIDNEDVTLTIKSNKTVINKIKEEPQQEGEQSQEAFMKGVEKDVQMRHEDKKIRREKCETIKIQGNKAFRRAEYEKALALYNKAVDLIRDSCVNYTNRSLTYIKLGFYDRAIKDCETALRLNEDSLKAHLYLAHCYYKLGDMENYVKIIDEALQRNPRDKGVIETYLEDLSKK